MKQDFITQPVLSGACTLQNKQKRVLNHNADQVD